MGALLPEACTSKLWNACRLWEYLLMGKKIQQHSYYRHMWQIEGAVDSEPEYLRRFISYWAHAMLSSQVHLILHSISLFNCMHLGPFWKYIQVLEEMDCGQVREIASWLGLTGRGMHQLEQRDELKTRCTGKTILFQCANPMSFTLSLLMKICEK